MLPRRSMVGRVAAAGRRIAGWSLIELTVILVVLSILCVIVAPVIGRFVRNAKLVRCREDVQAIGSAVTMFMEDTRLRYFYQDPSVDRSGPHALCPSEPNHEPVEILVSDGDVPEEGPNGSARWTLSVNFEDVDFFEYHLVSNQPGNDPSRAYRTPVDMVGSGFARRESGGFNSEYAWRGPYLTAPVDPDPWGNRYASNVLFLDPKADTGNRTPGANGCIEDVVVLSAGPDEEIDTRFSVDGLTAGDDDILYTVSGNSRP